jgi:hypothetical protein
MVDDNESPVDRFADLCARRQLQADRGTFGHPTAGFFLAEARCRKQQCQSDEGRDGFHSDWLADT